MPAAGQEQLPIFHQASQIAIKAFPLEYEQRIESHHTQKDRPWTGSTRRNSLRSFQRSERRPLPNTHVSSPIDAPRKLAKILPDPSL
jgi:hypothetical protein